MEGVWQSGPSYRTRLRYLNPLRWSKRTVKVFLVAFFTIMLPVYLYIGFHPASSLDLEGYPTLEIPSINLSTPVAEIYLEGRELIAPNTIAGVYHANPNKLFIIGHSSTVFKHLHELEEGDTFSYDNYVYHVTTISTLEKSDINMANLLAEAPEETIIIMTCAGKPLPNQDATHRLIITAIQSE